MTSPNDIMTAINLLLVGAYPDDTVYVNRRPKDFDRPSFLIECIRVVREDETRTTISITAHFTVTCFCKVDGHYKNDMEELLRRQTTVIDLFRRGYIPVGKRKIKVQASAGGMDFDRSFVDLQFDYFDSRGDTPEPAPLMDTVETKINAQEG